MSAEKIFGQRLAKLREDRKISRTDLANALIVTPQAVGKWERGESLPDVFLLKKIANIFGIKMDDFFAEGSIGDLEKSGSDNTRIAWDLSMSNWIDADLTGLKGVTDKFNFCNIVNCNLSNAELAGIIFKANNIKNCNFSNADISLSKQTMCSIQNNIFCGAIFKGSTLSSCSIICSDFSNADFSEAKICFGQISKSEFHQTKLFCTEFRNTYLADLTIQTDIENCSFTNCQFKNVVFKDMKILNTFFKNNKYKNCTFENCTADKISYAFLANSKIDLSGLEKV